MKNSLPFIMFLLFLGSPVLAQVADDSDGLYDSTSFVATDSNTNATTNSTVNSNNTNTNTSNITSTNTNNNVNNSTVTSTASNSNTNVSTVNSTATNNNVVSGGTNNTNTNNSTSTVDSTAINNNTNTNVSTSDSIVDQTVNSTSTNTNVSTNTNTNSVDSVSTNTNINSNTNDVNQTVTSPPPSAIAPTIMPGGNDTCTVSYSASVQTQILGASGGGHVRDINCERLKNSKLLYSMGMKVAAVAVMCQDKGVFDAMMMAGTPCPFNGKIGMEAQILWDLNKDLQPKAQKGNNSNAAANKILGSLLFVTLLSIGL